ncbi:MAG: nitrate reductase [Henriciella sp.]
MAFDRPSAGETATTCPYCGVGCGVLARPSENGLTAEVRGDPNHPSNFGKLCSKGSALGETLSQEERLLYPEINGVRTTWDAALDHVANGFKQTIAEHGPDSVAFYVSGQILTEDYYVANKLMKGFIGSANIDTNSRLCMASSVVGHKRAFGTDTVPGCYDDLDQADLVVMIGSNFAWCHPVLHQRLLAAKETRGTRIVVIDPRQTATTDSADLHLAIKPGGDVALYNWLLWRLASSPAFDPAYVDQFTNGFGEALDAAKQTTDAQVAAQTGLSLRDLEAFLTLLIKTQRVMTIYSQGVNQSTSGSDKVNAIVNTHLATGRIGKPGMGPFSITGQPNAMGGREVGGLANQLAAHMDFTTSEIDTVQRFWGSQIVPTAPGLKAVDMFDAVADGRIKAIWIMATNPVVSLPQADKVRAALRDCPLVIVSDVSATSDTVQLATVKLPATAWGEKSGTVTNSERRISRQRSFLKAPGEARHDWLALSQVAQRMGFAEFDYHSEADIYREHAALSAFENSNMRDFDIGQHAEISDDAYQTMAPYQWPLPKDRVQPGAMTGENHRFFADGDFYTPDRKACFVATAFEPPVKTATPDFPYILNTGRIRDHWHTMTRTGLSARLSGHIGEPFVEIHPKDARALGLKEAHLASVKSAHGGAVLRVMVTKRVKPGEVFAPIHWTDRFSSNGRIDVLVGPEVDPLSGQPDAKLTPVSVTPFDSQLTGFGVFETEPNAEVLSMLGYWALARAPHGWRLEFAANCDQASLAEMLLPDPDIAELSATNGLYRRASFEDNRLTGLLVLSPAGTVVADRAWLAAQIGCQHDPANRLSLLAARAGAGQSAGRMICSCHGVGANAICQAIAAGAATVDGIGNATGAGTNCGSCKPELRALLSENLTAKEKIAAE